MKQHLIVSTILLFFLAGTASAIDITQCGQTVARGQTGDLQTDLDCPMAGGFCAVDQSPCNTLADCSIGGCINGVYLERGAKLNLNGHTLKDGGTATIYCERNCRVDGPGRLEPTHLGIYSDRSSRINNVTVEGGWAGVYSQRSVRASDLTANNASSYGIFAVQKVRGANITVNGGALWGITAGQIVANGITVNNNGIHAMAAATIWATNLTAVGNGQAGVAGFFVRLKDSTVTGNGSIDVRSRFRPRLINTSCVHSTRYVDLGLNWGVCTAD